MAEPSVPAELVHAFSLSSAAPAGRQSGNINSVFACTTTLTTPPALCYLRLTPSHHRSMAEVEAELNWLRELASARLPVTVPILSRDGHYVVPFAGGVAVLLRSVGGRPARRPGGIHAAPADYTPRVIIAWATALARLHNHAADAAAASPAAGAQLRGRREWNCDPVLVSALAEVRLQAGAAPLNKLGSLVLSPSLEAVLASLRSCLIADAEWLLGCPRTPTNFGATHADLHFTNFHILDADGVDDSIGGRGSGDVSIGIFDFDDCCRHFFAHDVAVALTQLRKEGMLHRPVAAMDLERVFIRAYLAHRRLGEPVAGHAASEESRTLLEWLPRLVRFRAAVIMCWAAHELRQGRLAGEVPETWLCASLPTYGEICAAPLTLPDLGL